MLVMPVVIKLPEKIKPQRKSVDITFLTIYSFNVMKYVWTIKDNCYYLPLKIKRKYQSSEYIMEHVLVLSIISVIEL